MRMGIRMGFVRIKRLSEDLLHTTQTVTPACPESLLYGVWKKDARQASMID
jgi:hypothetical protein